MTGAAAIRDLPENLSHGYLQERDLADENIARTVFEHRGIYQLELGSGKGFFLTGLARKFPDVRFIGVEKRDRRCLKTFRRAERSGCKNLWIIKGYIETVITFLLPDNLFERIYVNFPDPWVKRRKRKHRTFTTETIGCLCNKLSRNGVFLMATDSADYASAVSKVTHTLPKVSVIDQDLCEKLYTEAELQNSFYARKKIEEGKDIHMIGFSRKENL